MKKMKKQTNLPAQAWNHLDKMNPLEFLDYASVLIFALTGALTASHAQLNRTALLSSPVSRLWVAEVSLI